MAPTIREVRPPHSTTGVESNQVVGVRFSEPMAISTLTNATVTLNNGRAVSGTVGTSEQGLMVFFVPAAPLTAGVTYTLSLSSGITDTAGNALPAMTSQFTINTGPVIHDVTPLQGEVGVEVIISGDFFDSIPTHNEVAFNGVAATVISATATTIVTTVPVGATTGAITVTVAGETATSQGDFIVVRSPSITSFQPTSGMTGTQVTITGQNFDPVTTNNQVAFHGVPAIVLSSSPTTIVAAAPVGVTTGPITVAVAGETATSAMTFTVETGPMISEVSPLAGSFGTPVMITGQGFDPTVANTQIAFAGPNGPIAGIISAVTSTTLTTTVPQQAVTGPVTVTTSQGAVTSPQSFTVTLSQDFILHAAPGHLSVLRGGQGSIAIGLIPIGSFTGLVHLEVSGLPVGMTAQFSSPTLSTGQTSYLTVSAAGTVPGGQLSFTLTGTAQLDNGPSTQTLPITLHLLGNTNQSHVSGQFRVLPDGIPLANVQVNLGAVRAQTDAAGNFLLQNVPTGNQLLRIDANSADPGMPMYNVNLDIRAGQTITLPPFWLARPPTQLTPINNATADQIISDPRIPDVEFTLPAGVTITGWDGVVKTQAGILKYSPDRLPIPSPPVPVRSLYHLHFGTPMGGLPTGIIPVTVPNDLGLDPGQEAEMWFFDSSPTGGAGGLEEGRLGHGERGWHEDHL